jgi:hypothetical protein
MFRPQNVIIRVIPDQTLKKDTQLHLLKRDFTFYNYVSNFLFYLLSNYTKT